MSTLRLLLLFAVLFPFQAIAQELPSEAVQIAGATSPLPETMKAGAAVLGYRSGVDGLVVLREGTNEMICLADNPTDERFQAACYARSLDPFMARGRELAKEGKKTPESREIRRQEIEAGSLKMPDGPAALYQLFGQADSFNLETGEVTNTRPLYVMYMPYATTETTGLATEAPMPGAPWLMDAGTPWAHIMYSPAAGN